MIVTVARQYGSGGHLVGQRLAERLKLRFFDHRLVEEVAQRLQMPVDWVEEHDEAASGWQERVQQFLACSVPDGVVAPPLGDLSRPPMTDEMLHRITREIIEQVARQGDALIVGRGAQALLGRRPGVYHIFVYAPRPFRVSEVMRRRSINERAAAALVESIDRRRAEYLRFNYGADWRQPELYQLMIDTSLTGVDGAVDMAAGWLARVAAEGHAGS